MSQLATKATITDLLHHEGKAELIGGRIVPEMAAGRRHSLVGFNIAVSLRMHAKIVGRGEAHPDNVVFSVPELSTERESFSPDASYYAGELGPMDDEPGVIEGPPTFAVEVRNDDDYGPVAESKLADKRAEYFEAGTEVVWDVDPEAKIVSKYVPTLLDRPTNFAIGTVADAEPAVPGWRMVVADIFAG